MSKSLDFPPNFPSAKHRITPASGLYKLFLNFVPPGYRTNFLRSN